MQSLLCVLLAGLLLTEKQQVANLNIEKKLWQSQHEGNPHFRSDGYMCHMPQPTMLAYEDHPHFK